MQIFVYFLHYTYSSARQMFFSYENLKTVFLSLSLSLFVDECESFGCKAVNPYRVLSTPDSRHLGRYNCGIGRRLQETTFGYNLSLPFLSARCFPKVTYDENNKAVCSLEMPIIFIAI